MSDYPKPVPDGLPEVMSDENAARLVAVVLGLGPVFEFMNKLKELSNYELAGLLVDHVWAYMPLDKPQAKLLDEIIDRLKRDVVDDDCPVCGGSGKGVGGIENGCPRCKGNGVVVTGQGAAR